MKKHFSVFMLMARSSIYKILCLFVSMSAIEVVLFTQAMEKQVPGGDYGMELAISQSYMVFVFGEAFLILTFFLSRTGYEMGSKLSYTLKRLSVSERMVFVWQSIYNMTCYVSFWMLQVLVAILCCFIYTKTAAPELVTAQSMFLAFYRSDFLHSLIPFNVSLLWVKNIILIIALGLATASVSAAQRKGKRSLEIVFLVCVAIGFFLRPLGEYTSAMIVMGCSYCSMAISVKNGLLKEVAENEN